MKKTLALFLALLLVLSLAACGSNEPKPLPVKFGSVTDVEILGTYSDAIVLSMDEPTSAEDVEREVYIAAIDYIFTHGYATLKELSVTAYDPTGNIILAFTIPSDIIANMREVEAQGSWGTAGFCAYYYMNHDAYDELVANITAANE